MKYQRGVALSSLIFWSIILFFAAVLTVKVIPTVIEYYKIKKDAESVLTKVGPDSTVAEVRATFDRFANIDALEFSGKDLDISKENGKIVIDFEYDKKIPLFANVNLLIEYKGSAGR
jgi:predicted membrane protein